MKNLISVLVVLMTLCFTAQAQWVDISPVAAGTYNTVAGNGNHLFASAMGSGVYLSTDNGTNWTKANAGLTDTNVASLFVSGSNLFAGANGGGVFLSTNNGTSWTLTGALGTNTSQVHNITAFNSKLFAGTLSSGIYVSTNNGTSWTQTTFPTANQVRAIIVSGTNLFAGTMNGGVYISTNNGTNWTQVNSGGLLDSSVTSLSAYGTNLFAGVNGGNSVYLSTNNGTTWTVKNSGFAGWGVYVQSIAAIGMNNVFAGTFLGGVYQSTDNGTSWVTINTGFTGNPMVGALFISSKDIFAGVSPMGAPYNSPGGLWRRPLTDLGLPVELTTFTANVSGHSVQLNWATATETNNKGFEIQKKSTNGQFINVGFVSGKGTTTQAQNYSFVDKSESGKYTYRLKQIDLNGVVDISKSIEVFVAPDNFELGNNYPNPFNPSTKISFNLSVDSKVSLKVYNLLGQEVASLFNGNLLAGTHVVNFNASNLSTGVYMYKLEAAGIDGQSFNSVKKMILNK
jgi:photosystem II stability/assembly factor-like uncharacterized protein